MTSQAMQIGRIRRSHSFIMHLWEESTAWASGAGEISAGDQGSNHRVTIVTVTCIEVKKVR